MLQEHRHHADATALRAGYVYELAILAEAQRYLDWLYHNQLDAQKLMVPDGSCKIFDSADKLSGLTSLSVEMDELIREVGKEQSPLLRSGTPTLDASRANDRGVNCRSQLLPPKLLRL